MKILRFETDEGTKNKAMIVERIAELRTKLEGSISEADTNETRGAIRELRSLIQAPMQHLTTPHYSGMDFRQQAKRGEA